MPSTRPFVEIKRIFKESVSENGDFLKFIFEKSDSIHLWIIGLSIGSVSIIANNIGDIKNAISPEFLKPILFLLTISVISGIFFRIYYLYFFVVLTNTSKYLQIAFSESKNNTMDTESRLTGNETFFQILDILKNNFDEDLFYLTEIYTVIEPNAKEILHKNVVEHYIKLVEYAKKEEAFTFQYIAETYNRFTGISTDKFLEKLYSDNNGRHFKITLRITMSLYIIYIMSFIAALITFVIAA